MQPVRLWKMPRLVLLIRRISFLKCLNHTLNRKKSLLRCVFYLYLPCRRGGSIVVSLRLPSSAPGFPPASCTAPLGIGQTVLASALLTLGPVPFSVFGTPRAAKYRPPCVSPAGPLPDPSHMRSACKEHNAGQHT